MTEHKRCEPSREVWSELATPVGLTQHNQIHHFVQIIQEALVILNHMSHRGGCGCDQFSGDGTGIMTAIPHDLYLKILRFGIGSEIWIRFGV